MKIFKNFGKTDNLWTDKLWKTTVNEINGVNYSSVGLYNFQALPKFTLMLTSTDNHAQKNC